MAQNGDILAQDGLGMPANLHDTHLIVDVVNVWGRKPSVITWANDILYMEVCRI